MRRPWVLLIAGAVAVALAVAVVAAVHKESTDDGPLATLPPPAACEPGARDLNPENDPVEPARGSPLIDRIRGHIPVGFNDSAFLTGQLTLEQALALYEATDSTIWRLPLDWGQVEHSPGELDFSRYDEIYCAAVAAGVRPLWHLTGIPLWAAPVGACPQGPCVRPPEDEHLPQLAHFAEIAAIRYPRSAAFEAWNEPNLVGFWGGPPNPDDYLPILEAVYEGTKNGNPGMPVLGGALSNNPTDVPNGNVSFRTFLEALLAGDGLASMDALAIHAYPIASLGGPGDQFTAALEAARAGLAAHGGEGVRIWVTEAGAPTEEGGPMPAVNVDQQATILSDAYTALDRATDVDAAIFHTLVDPPPTVPGGPGFGFFEMPVGEAVRAKPVACRILEDTSSPAPCPSVVDL